ncbi:MAG TPA: SBBP repeat-containing protein, partial [Bryobacteraceae bacterium]|nr:SBBP repeat-containing protein [Bryobacteraceae bacterium]
MRSSDGSGGCRNAVAGTILLAALFAPASHAQIVSPGDELDANAKTRLLEAWRTRPLSFESNGGQSDPRVRFFARHGSSTLFLTADEAVISLSHRTDPEASRTSALSMTWMGSNASARADGVDELPSKTNYLIGSDPAKWRRGVPTYARIQYHDLYPGVDLIYHGERGQLEYDLALAPGASSLPIRMKFDGTSRIAIDRSGDLILKAGGQEIRFRKPVAYQIADGGHIPVAARFVRKGRHDVGFEIGDYDHSRSLVIDPQLSYSSYLGGSASDEGEKLAVDTNGNAYIVGFTSSTNFPVVAPFQSVNKGTTSIVISKLNPEAAGAASLVYSTYLGGSGANIGRAIAVDSVGQVYIAGDTNAPNFPVTPGAFQAACKLQAGVCSTDVFAARLDATGSTLLYSTYLGGSGNEFGFAIAIDFAGHMFVGANTGSPNMPVTSGAFQTSFAGGGASFGDAYVAELNPAGQGAADLLYATYFGGSGSEALWALAVDGAGAIDFTGSTASNNLPVTSSAFSRTYSGTGSLGLGDAFVVKLNPAGQGAADLVYSTYLGGASDDRGEGIAVDGLNRIFLTGFTTSSAFPVTAATAFDSTFGGGTCSGAPCADAFLAKLDPALSGAASLVYSTFLGGSGFDLGHSIALDGNGLVYVTGETGSTNFPVVSPIQSTCFGGCTPPPIDDVFIAKFDLSQTGAAALLFSTYLGGNDVDTGWSIAVDSKGDALVTGQTFSTNFPTEMPFQSNCNNCSSFIGSKPSGDSFLVKVCITSCPSASPVPASLTFAAQDTGTTSPAQSVTFTNNGSGDLTIVAITLTGANAADFSQTDNCPSVLTPGASCQIDATFSPTAGGSRVANISISNNGGTNPQLVGLTGTGVAPVPVVGLAPSSLNFGNQTQNTTSAAQSITVTNNGPGTLAITGIAITGA